MQERDKHKQIGGADRKISLDEVLAGESQKSRLHRRGRDRLAGNRHERVERREGGALDRGASGGRKEVRDVGGEKGRGVGEDGRENGG